MIKKLFVLVFFSFDIYAFNFYILYNDDSIQKIEGMDALLDSWKEVVKCAQKCKTSATQERPIALLQGVYMDLSDDHWKILYGNTSSVLETARTRYRNRNNLSKDDPFYRAAGGSDINNNNPEYYQGISFYTYPQLIARWGTAKDLKELLEDAEIGQALAEHIDETLPEDYDGNRGFDHNALTTAVSVNNSQGLSILLQHGANPNY